MTTAILWAFAALGVWLLIHLAIFNWRLLETMNGY